MISTVLTLFSIVVLVFTPGPSWADSPVETPDQAILSTDAQCKSPELTFEKIIQNELTVEANAKVYCQFRIFCPAEHKCCNVGPTFWCCPLPSKCDPNMDADDWTGCHGAHGVNPL